VSRMAAALGRPPTGGDQDTLDVVRIGDGQFESPSESSVPRPTGTRLSVERGGSPVGL
jgi:hypothetical protein